MCGDHNQKPQRLRNIMGSPPHVRGPPNAEVIEGEFEGITPACAGTTIYISLAIVFNRDHPRMCGDHYRKEV